jgi:hypothetical protein
MTSSGRALDMAGGTGGDEGGQKGGSQAEVGVDRRGVEPVRSAGCKLQLRDQKCGADDMTSSLSGQARVHCRHKRRGYQAVSCQPLRPQRRRPQHRRRPKHRSQRLQWPPCRLSRPWRAAKASIPTCRAPSASKKTAHASRPSTLYHSHLRRPMMPPRTRRPNSAFKKRCTRTSVSVHC